MPRGYRRRPLVHGDPRATLSPWALLDCRPGRWSASGAGRCCRRCETVTSCWSAAGAGLDRVRAPGGWRWCGCRPTGRSPSSGSRCATTTAGGSSATTPPRVWTRGSWGTRCRTPTCSRSPCAGCGRPRSVSAARALRAAGSASSVLRGERPRSPAPLQDIPATPPKGSVQMLTRLRDALVRSTVSAHCDLPCGVYDPAQARIEAESVKMIISKANASSDPDFRTRAILIKEQRAELVKHHLWVLWTDYFKPPHFEKYPHLHQLFNEATKLAGAGGAKGTLDESVADQLLGKIEEIAKIFWETKQA